MSRQQNGVLTCTEMKASAIDIAVSLPLEIVSKADSKRAEEEGGAVVEGASWGSCWSENKRE